MEDSSEDDIPIGARRSFKAATTLDLTEDSDGGSPLPDWISQHTPVTTAKQSSDSSDSEDGVTLVSQSEPVDHSQPKGTAAPKQSQATGKAAAIRKMTTIRTSCLFSADPHWGD